MSFTGNFVDARTALRLGLVNHVVAHDELLPFCRQAGRRHRRRRPARSAAPAAHLREIATPCRRRLGGRGRGRRGWQGRGFDPAEIERRRGGDPRARARAGAALHDAELVAAYETLLVERDGPMATLTINRPAQLNALYRQSYLDFEQALSWARDDDSVRVVVITGAGDRAFWPPAATSTSTCRSSRRSARRAWSPTRASRRETILRIRELDKPVIARVTASPSAAAAHRARMRHRDRVAERLVRRVLDPARDPPRRWAAATSSRAWSGPTARRS